MKKIQQYVNRIKEEVADAKEYALDYLDLKSNNDSFNVKYREMANDELKHAMLIHDMAVLEIGKLKNVYTPPVEMEEKWNTEHRVYLEKVAEVKQLLQM